MLQDIGNHEFPLFCFAGIDLISGVSCKKPFEWVDSTKSEWDFNTYERDSKTYCVSIVFQSFCLNNKIFLYCLEFVLTIFLSF